MEAILAGAGLSSGTWEGGASPVHYAARAGREPTLLCLHGLGDSHLTFPEFLSVPDLRPFGALAPDVPGFGRSPRHPGTDRALAGQAALALALADALGIRRFVVVGHSMGGAVAVHLAETAPNRCLGILSLEGNLTPPDCTLSREAVRAEHDGRYGRWRNSVVARYEEEGGRGEAGKLRYLVSFSRSDAEAFLDASHALVAESSGSELGRRYRELPQPRLYLLGGKSSPPETRLFLRAHRLDQAVFPESGHWVHWDAREEAAAACRKFLDRSVAG